MDKENWKMIIDVFKIIEGSIFIIKDETSYIMALYACKQTKKWKWSYRFLTRGKAKNEFSPKFYEVLQELASDLPEEEAKKFLFDGKSL